MGPDQHQRVPALRECRVLDAPVADELSAVVRVAAMVAGVPTATLNLLDENPACRDGDLRFHACVPLVTAAGRTLGTLCVSDSVPVELTDERLARLEDLAEVVLALVERRRQAGVNAEFERFAAEVGHDLASPMGVVYGYLELLDDHYATELDERGHRWIGSAMRAVGRMRTLTESLLTDARAGGDPCRSEDAGDTAASLSVPGS